MNDHAFDRESIERIRREPNERARTSLIGGFLRQKEGLIRHLARKAAAAEKTELDLEDILQAGRIGMLKAMDTWDPDRSSIATWAGWKIKRCVQDAAHANQAIALPQIRGTTADRNRIVLAVRENPDVTAAELGIKPGMLERVKKTIGLRYVSVDMFGDGDDAPARQRKIERRITDSTEQDDADDVLDVRRAIEHTETSVITGARICGMPREDYLIGVAGRLGFNPIIVVATPKKEKRKCSKPKITTTQPLTRSMLALLKAPTLSQNSRRHLSLVRLIRPLKPQRRPFLLRVERQIQRRLRHQSKNVMKASVRNLTCRPPSSCRTKSVSKNVLPSSKPSTLFLLRIEKKSSIMCALRSAA